jgi:hypothetical protein
MDTSTPGIRFDAAGHCTYCKLHDRMETSLRPREGTVDALCEKIRKSGRGRAYDCVVGLSGGTDSTYCLYVTKKLGLRPLAVHYDNGFVSETATANIKATAERLKVEVRTVRTNWDSLRSMYRACLEASVPEICLPCEVGVYTALHRVAAEVGAHYIILGLSYKTEGITPLAWHYCDGLYIADIFKRHGGGEKQPAGFDGLDLTSFARHALRHRIRTVQLPLYMREYKDREIQAELTRELGWVYGGHHHFDCAYKPFVGHIQARKFNIDYRKVTLSALVRTGQSSRESALASLQQVPTATDAEVRHCLERLEMTQGDLERILATPTRAFRDYRSYYSVVSRLKLPLKLMARLGIVPETTYEKLFET